MGQPSSQNLSRADRLSAAAEPRGIGRAAARSIAWLVGQTLASKLVNTLGSIILAWLLVPADWGDVGLALAICALAMLLQQPGIQQILMQRFARFGLWATPAFWMSLTAGTLAGLLLYIVAPYVAAAIDKPALVGLLRVLALTGPLGALSFVPTAQLQAQMRFRAVALISLCANVAMTVLTIVFAWKGMGAYSFVVPRPIVFLAQAIVSLAWARPDISLKFHFRRWRYLVADSGLLAGVAVSSTVLTQGDYILLGLFHDRTVVGIYYFAFGLSTQVIQLLSGNVAGAIMPTMRLLLDNPRRLKNAFVEACRSLAFMGVPLCLAQAAAAQPLFRLLFKPEWAPSIPVFQILSIGMAALLVGVSVAGLFQAQSRNAGLFTSHAVFASTFLLMVWIGASRGAALGTAVAVAIHALILAPVSVYWAIRPMGGTWRDLRDIFAFPFLAGAVAATAAYFLANFLPGVTHLPARVLYCIQLAVIGVTVLAIYLPLAKYLAPQTLSQLLTRWRTLVAPGRSRSEPGPI